MNNENRTPINRTIIMNCNKAFFISGMMSELQGVAFEDALYKGQHQPTAYPFMHAGYPCRMIVDVVALREMEGAEFLNNIKKAVDGAIDRIPLGICGDLNDRVRVESGPYRFEFGITGYWCTKSPDDDLVEDPTGFPVGEHLGREVSLRISLAA